MTSYALEPKDTPMIPIVKNTGTTAQRQRQRQRQQVTMTTRTTETIIAIVLWSFVHWWSHAFSPTVGQPQPAGLLLHHPRILPWTLSSSSSSSSSTTSTTTATTTFSTGDGSSRPTELPDSLEDAAERAAKATADFVLQQTMTTTTADGSNNINNNVNPPVRCRVDFDTSAGDETFPLLKTSSEFMQNYVSACCYALIPGLQQARQDEMMRLVQAKAQLRTLQQEQQQEQQGNDPQQPPQQEEEESINEDNDEDEDDKPSNNDNPQLQEELMNVIRRQGRSTTPWTGPICRVYFPDEGNAALARRDWLNEDNPKVPINGVVQFSSCSGIQMADISRDQLVFYFCPRAAEAQVVEQLLERAEQQAATAADGGGGSSMLQMTCFVNPNLVDMGVTGFGMAGRLLRERLLDKLVCTYYLRTLAWGALTRQWPQKYSVWQEDATAPGGYKLLQALNTLPSNPEVEDIYDLAAAEDNNNESGGQGGGRGGNVLDQLGDFMQGMMRL